MRDVSDEENMWDLVAPNTQHLELNDTRENCRNSDINLQNSEKNYDLSDDLGISSSYVAEQLTTYHEIPDEEYHELVRSLNSEHLIFFSIIFCIVLEQVISLFIVFCQVVRVLKNHM